MAPLTHIVLFNLSSAPQAEVDRLSAAFLALETQCVNPTTKQPYIKSIKGGKNNSSEGLSKNFTHAYVVEFATAQDRDYYTTEDPAHKAFAGDAFKALGGPEDALVVDFHPGVFA